MNKFVIKIMLVIFLLAGGAFTVQAEEMNRPPKQERRMKPPPEAIAACKGKSEGTKVQFTTPRGDTLTGICKQFEGTLAAMPKHGAPPPGNGSVSDETGTGR
ncbi:MAG: hypothetical protein ABFD75_03845 [Smithella sp.]